MKSRGGGQLGDFIFDLVRDKFSFEVFQLSIYAPDMSRSTVHSTHNVPAFQSKCGQVEVANPRESARGIWIAMGEIRPSSQKDCLMNGLYHLEI